MDGSAKVKKDINYYISDRKDLFSVLPDKAERVLDVGCGNGALGKALKERGVARKVVGIEINAKAASDARYNIDEVISVDIESAGLKFEKEYFDLIIFGDVLEHLYNPWKVLAEMKAYLKKDGHILISIPNVRYYRVLCGLIFKGEFKYEEDGILDKDHIRFFTLKMLRRYAKDAGLKIVKIKRNFSGHFSFLFNLLCLNLFADFFTRQYIILCSAKD